MALFKSMQLGKATILVLVLVVFSLVVSLLCISYGELHFSLSELWSLGLEKIGIDKSSLSDTHKEIILRIRVPRIILGYFVGGALAVAGVVFQILLKNVLAEPYILGISSGASIGSLLAIAFGVTTTFYGATALCAFVGALLVIVFVYFVGRRKGVLESKSLLLSGVMIGAFLSAVILVLIAVIGDRARNALFWLLGNLGTENYHEIYLLIPVVLCCVVVLCILSKQFNLLAFDESIAHQLGVQIRRVRQISYVIVSLLTGIVVSVCGSIGFIGLLVPHMCRLMFGSDHRILLPTSFFCGAVFILTADWLARNVLYPSEIPVGAITAVLGAPLFIIIMKLSD